MSQLNGKRALVTGSSRGIGQQIAIELASQGVNLVLHGRKKENLERTLELVKPYKVEVDVVEGDLSDEQSVAAMIQAVKDKYPTIDVLYNNAAIQTTAKKIWDFTRADYQKLFDVNFYSVVQICQAFVPGMVEQGYGRVINITSGIKDQPDLNPYGVSKAMIDKFTEDFAVELKGTGVLVNALDPGWLRTDLGGPNAEHDVVTVRPGAIELALFAEDGPNGKWFSAQEIRLSKTK